MKAAKQNKKVAIIMGSKSDHPIMKECEKILKVFKIKYEVFIISAHRTPQRMYEFAKHASNKGFAVIIAGAGGSAHLPGLVASLSLLPVVGVPIESKKLKGLDSILSLVCLPKGCPLATMPINGAYNAGLYAAEIIGTYNSNVRNNLKQWKKKQAKSIKQKP